MKITTIIKKNNGSAKRDNEEIRDAANRLRLCHERLLAELEMKGIDLDYQLRKHMASVNVCGDVDMWSQQLLDIRKKVLVSASDIDLAKAIYTELFI